MSHTVTVTRTTTSTTSAIILNTGYVKSAPGLLKLIEVILGGIILFMLFIKRNELCRCWIFDYNTPYFFFSSIVATFCITSLILLISCLLSISTGPIISKTNFEFIYHGTGFVLLLIVAIYLFAEQNEKKIENLFLSSSIIAMIMSALYLLSAIWGYRSYKGP
ncbi:uncharacterized protein LOC126900630 [Daktulosphaira vitifoliae]|uniref:uncharacterized protein LOC126900630 n=1 Tax=Daktulosphaira vitifoliae TaxID=58002 RepID=UPI0021AA3A1B|nr:uncharacterized protein LOC126900630 [Daktulosphaira vitifoliae]XP_050532439.1 uncharacterized protein LOC126900630 [Daktulosphaira vitifoliae]XP_050532440.1 uncharacterized protein LOC126900630 [Daktulosphaira vitifoliae]